MDKLLTSKKFTTVLAFLGLYLMSTGIAWALFNSGAKAPISFGGELDSARSKINEEPKTEECPINGGMFSKTERKIWEQRRPLLAIIENHSDSRPQSGLSRADVVYEVVAEGGITRFLGVYYCGASADDVAIGPLRSARVYLISWAREYGKNPLLVHFGGANNICGNCPGGIKPEGVVAKEVMALEQLNSLGWRGPSGNALDGGTNVSYPAIKRDQTRLGHESAWEHSAIGSTDDLFQLGIDRGYGYKENGQVWDKDFTMWKFADDQPVNTPKASSIKFNFWKGTGAYDVEWKYDKSTNSYLRFNGGKPHTDWEYDNAQITAKNVAIMFVVERGPVDQEKHMYYETVDEGNAIIFQNGDAIEGTWEKGSHAGRTKFYDKSGKEISFVRGTTWIEAVPKGNNISY